MLRCVAVAGVLTLYAANTKNGNKSHANFFLKMGMQMLGGDEAMKDFDKNVGTIENVSHSRPRPASFPQEKYQMRFSSIHLKWTWRECII